MVLSDGAILLKELIPLLNLIVVDRIHEHSRNGRSKNELVYAFGTIARGKGHKHTYRTATHLYL